MDFQKSHSKTCFKCGEEKGIDEFYKHPKMKSGTINKCKECTKKENNQNRKDKAEHYSEYEKQRNKTSQRKKRKLEYAKTRRKRKPYTGIVSNQLHRAIKSGEISKPEECSCCGKKFESKLIHGHHHDYTEPLKVIWLCAWCHKKIHRYLDQVNDIFEENL